MIFTVYILRTSANTLYTGQTNNLEKRLKEHTGKGSRSAKYTRAFGCAELVYTEEYGNRSDAMKREAQIKKLTRQQKDKLLLTKLLP